MATEKQTQANRQNAQKSTGPRTPEGKARSCLNHLTTGIDAQSVVIPGENPADRKSLADRYFDQFQPATEDERHQVEILIHCDWQARRFERCEAQTWSRSIEGLFRPDPPTQMGAGYTLYSKTFERLDRRVEKNERLYNHARHELEKLQSVRRAAEAETTEPETTEPETPAAPEPVEALVQTEAPAPVSDVNSRFEPNSPTPATPKFGPEPATDPAGPPDFVPVKSA